MRLLDTLIEDHRDVQDLLDRIAIDEGMVSEERQALMHNLRALVLAHSQGEEEEVYPELARHQAMSELMIESRADHAQVEQMLIELEHLGMGSTAWEETFQDLADAIEEHVTLEEGDVFARVRETIDQEQADALLERFRARKDEVMTALMGHPAE